MIRWSYVEVSVITLLTARRASVSSAAPWYSAGYSIAPTPTIAPWPAINRGTEWTVPMVPGLVRLIVVPAKSSAVSLPVRALRMRSSYAAQNREKSSVSAFLMFGTTSEREPSSFARSIARPRLTWSGDVTAGLPSVVVNARFMTGNSASARTSAKPIRCVKETLPPRPRRRWLLMTTRLSISSFAGIARTLVAVGTARLASMLETTRAAAPLSGWLAGGPDGSRRAWEAASPSLVPRSVAPLLPTALARSVGAPAGFVGFGLAFSASFSFDGAVDAAGAFGDSLAGFSAEPLLFAGAGLAVDPELEPVSAGWSSAKKSHQALSTDSGSLRYCWSIS